MKGVVSRGRELDERLKRVIDSHATNIPIPADSEDACPITPKMKQNRARSRVFASCRPVG